MVDRAGIALKPTDACMRASEPPIAVAALNRHAGDDGSFDREEIVETRPS